MALLNQKPRLVKMIRQRGGAFTIKDEGTATE